MANRVSDVNDIYLMNFLFDPSLVRTPKTFKGQFCDEPPTPLSLRALSSAKALQRSRNWLVLSGTHSGDFKDFVAVGKSWIDQGDISNSTLLICRHTRTTGESEKAIGSGVLIRVATFLGQSKEARTRALEVELAICFGNSDPARQGYASPFKEIPPGVVRTTFYWPPIGPNQPDGAWCFDIGEVLEWPKSPNQVFHYGFALGIRVHGLGAHAFDFSMDPEMDVSI